MCIRDRANVRSQIEVSKGVLSTEQAADNKLMLLQGWAPATQIPEITNFLNQQEAYFEIADPTPEDNVPIQLDVYKRQLYRRCRRT